MNLSEPQLISPLLDGFVMGDPISGHHGVRACPAMQLEQDKKYIVKIISLPADPSKLDALLLAGAFTDRESALSYFKELADGVLEEAALLQKLARHEGFVSFENWQMVTMEDGETGFDIYLLGQYHPTLDGILRNNEMTHLQAINLGLDLCAALSASRRSGFLFSNLKPSNIYLFNEREFRIGDLGFLSMDSLQYASLPEKYHSDYTPPEISDAFSALNTTMDTYAVGLILYQAYNDGRLPPVTLKPEAPKYADPALAEIILKACAVEPGERWQDPMQMGQALANYLQSNTVNDVPIAPQPEPEPEAAPVAVFPNEDTEPTTEDILAEVDEALDNAPPIVAAPAPTEEDAEAEQTVEEPAPEEETASEEDELSENTLIVDGNVFVMIEEDPVTTAEETDAVGLVEGEAEAETEETATADEVIEDASQQEDPQDETSQMLAQADALIAHQLPDPPVAPEPIEVTLPEPEGIPETAEEAESDPVTDAESISVSANAESPNEEDDDNEEEDEPVPVVHRRPKDGKIADKFQKNSKIVMIAAIVLTALLVLSAAALCFYQYSYLQTIHNMTLAGSEDTLTVTLTTDIADEKLTVRCIDTHGNSLEAEVIDGVAHFAGLRPGTTYDIEVRIEGFHKLIGKTMDTYATSNQTVIGGFYAATGSEDGSVVLSFTPQGPDSAQWTVTYSAEGEATQSVTFKGHLVTVNGLTIGKEYTFKLSPVTELYLSGTDTITYTASAIVYPEDIRIGGFIDGNLVISWKTPEGMTIPQWYVRCYNDAGFDKTLSTTENTITFEDMDSTSGYTVEVIAEGMTRGSRNDIAANSITLTNVNADASGLTELKISWTCEAPIPTGGWTVFYTIDGSAERQYITCTENFATITPLIPGANYYFSITAAPGTCILGGVFDVDIPATSEFDKYLVTSGDMEFSMCKTPNRSSWNHTHVAQSDYTTSFQIGESASFVSHLTKRTSKLENKVTTLYVIRDAEGSFISANKETRTWDDMWDDRYGELTIPVMPDVPGSYTVEIYFDGCSVTTQSFEILASE